MLASAELHTFVQTVDLELVRVGCLGLFEAFQLLQLCTPAEK